MSKDFKRCPRCNYKTPTNMGRCGNCGLNYIKFEDATVTEAKSAFRMGEKERVLHTKKIPSDINKWKMLLLCLLGGWFGLHYFTLGKKWRGLFQIFGLLMMMIYAIFAGKYGIRSGYLGNLILVCGILWASTVIVWWSNCLAILFNRFKYPVSLPYSESKEKKSNYTETKKQHNVTEDEVTEVDIKGE